MTDRELHGARCGAGQAPCARTTSLRPASRFSHWCIAPNTTARGLVPRWSARRSTATASPNPKPSKKIFFIGSSFARRGVKTSSRSNSSHSDPATNHGHTVISCVLNRTARSDGAAQHCDEVKALFQSRGMPVDVAVADDGASITQLARQAIAAGATTIVAGGGDGTISAVASTLVNSKIALGVLPMGTLNHFAKDIGVPLALEDAVDTVLAGHVRAIDVGGVNGAHFINNASLGLYPAIVQEREEAQLRGHSKWLSFAKASLSALMRYRQIYIQLTDPEGIVTREETPFVFVGNNEYEVSGSQLGKRRTLDGGQLWVYRAPHANRVQLLSSLIQAVHRFDKNAGIEVFSAGEFSITSNRHHLRIAIDGEVIRMSTPLQFNIHRGALNVITPSPLANG